MGCYNHPPKKKSKVISKMDKTIAITQSPNTRSTTKKQRVGESKGNEIVVVNSKDKKKVVRKDKKKVVTNEDYKTLKIRTSPNSLYLAMQSLTTEQKEWVISTGFESILTTKIDSIPSKMAFYIVDNLDTDNMRLNFREASIEITPDSVHQMLGVPIGGLDLNSLDCAQDEEDITTEWKKQFENLKVRPMEIMRKIKSSQVNDFNFKINFIALFVSTMADCNNMGCCNLGFLSHLRKDTNLRNIDRCKLIFDFLKTSKQGLKRSSELSFYSGPITFLTLLYVDSTTCSTPDVQRRRPSIGSWNTDLLKRRETAEIDRGGFGLGKIVEEQTEEDIMEGYIDRLHEKISWMIAEKITIEATLHEARSRFPDEEYFLEFKEKLDNLFMVVRKNMNDEGVISLNKSTSDATCYDGNDNDVNVEKVDNQPKTTNPEPPKNYVQLDVVSVQQPNATIDDPFPASQYWYRPGFHRSCDKTVERVTRVDAEGAPSYSLDFSPLDGEKNQTETTKTTEVEDGVRRALILSQHLRSPYVKRIVDISTLQNRDEKMVSNWISAGVGPSSEVVYETTSFKAFRYEMEALVVGLSVPSNVIDSWTSVLNDEEKYKSNEALRRMFFNTKVVAGIMNQALEMDKRFDIFAAKLTAAAPISETLTMRNVDLVFFPLVCGINYYLMVFNLKNPAVVIIDNHAYDDEVKNIYGIVPSNVQHLISRYLLAVHHPSCDEITKAVIEQLSVRWCTKTKGNEGGVFLMRHMETYMGEPTHRWKSGLFKECTRQKNQLYNLRRKYAAKVLLSDINSHRVKVIEQSEKFHALSEGEKIKHYEIAHARRTVGLKTNK